MYTMMSDDSTLPPAKLSIDQVRSRFASEDIELTCRKRVEMEITILHPTDDDGRPIIAENIVSLRFFATSGGHQEENERWIDWITLQPLESRSSNEVRATLTLSKRANMSPFGLSSLCIRRDRGDPSFSFSS